MVQSFSYPQYCWMMADESRMRPYSEALRQSVSPKSVVLDIGSGTGIFSFLACKYGARKVYAVEPNQLSELAKGFARQFGFQDKIEFYDQLSTDVQFDEPADILICDLRDCTPLNRNCIQTIADARSRLLKPNATIIATKDVMRYALVKSNEVYENSILRYTRDFYGFNFASSKRLLTNRILFPDSNDLTQVSESREFTVIDYRTVEETSFTNSMEWEINEEVTIHGLRGWFDSEVGFGETLTTSAENPGNVYGVQFLPFDEPIIAKSGDRIEVSLGAKYVEGNYVWTWNTRYYDIEQTGEPRVKFFQSTEAGIFITPSDIQKRSEYYLPELNENAEINLMYLRSVDGELLLGDIADLLHEKFPEKFKDFDEAFSHAGILSQHYSK